MTAGTSFILDVVRTRNGVDIWEITKGRLSCRHEDQPPSFMVSFPDPHLYYSLVEGLESLYPVEECIIHSIYGEYDGYLVGAGREVAEQVEQQTRHQANLYNVDIRPEQLFCARIGIVPGAWAGTDRLLLDPEIPLNFMEISCSANPHRSDHPGIIRVTADGRTSLLDGPDRTVLDDLFDIIQSRDPDVILFPEYDIWSVQMCRLAETWGLENTLSRNGRFSSLSSRSYFSYGRMEHRTGARMPQGRLIIDSRQSFMYREGDIRGILLASRLTGLSPNLTCRLTPGTLVSGYEVYEALLRGIAVPFRKQDAEGYRVPGEMRLDLRGGLTLQPNPGVYTEVVQIDFTSFYPSIIVKYNLSPETLSHPEKRGFLPVVLDPLLKLRLDTKRRKKEDPRFRGMDGILKWMLVTCFGYTGYKNARFGRIEVHEQITLKATTVLGDCIRLTEEMGGTVLHGIIDCLFVKNCSQARIAAAIEEFTGFHIECEIYDWVVFLPQADGTGSYANYYGRLPDGSVKFRGIAARRRTTPPYVKQMQEQLLAMMGKESDVEALSRLFPVLEQIYHQYRDGLLTADSADLVITRRIGREVYQNHCLAQAVINAYRLHGIELKPGMDASYVVRDEKRHIADPAFDPQGIDTGYYHRLIDKAWEEIRYAVHSGRD